MTRTPLAAAQENQPDDAATTVKELSDLVQEFVAERDWQKYHNAKNLSMSLAIEAAEVMEHFQWLTTEEVEQQDEARKSAIADELADVLAYLLGLANCLEIDLSQSLTAKMAKNRLKYPVGQPYDPRKQRP